ncbi:hypothetical protein QTH97_26120 [Variovorax sp. J22R24]|nr:hypothetical protein [Variovorax sp. J22R24]MDM0108452.1 hypothetical protein [Variovorax sp. J22R24]
MTATFRFVIALLVMYLSGCGGPKPPPGWPTGDERPINPSHVTKAAK